LFITEFIAMLRINKIIQTSAGRVSEQSTLVNVGLATITSEAWVAHAAVLSIGICDTEAVVQAEARRTLRWVVALRNTVIQTLAKERANRAVHRVVQVQVNADQVAVVVPWIVELNNLGLSEHLSSTRILKH
jgi:hypothetical protein